MESSLGTSDARHRDPAIGDATVLDAVLLSTGFKEYLRQTAVPAALRELELRGRISCEQKRVDVLDPDPTGDLGLDAALEMIAGREKPRKLVNWIDNRKLQKSVVCAAREVLVAAGAMRFTRPRLLGLIPLKAYTPVDERREPLRERIRSAYLDEQGFANVSDPRLVDLIVLLKAGRITPSLFSRAERKLMRKRTETETLPLDASQVLIESALAQAVAAAEARQAAASASA